MWDSAVVVQNVIAFLGVIVGGVLSAYAAKIATNQEKLARTQVGNTIYSRMFEIDQLIINNAEQWHELIQQSNRTYKKAEPTTHFFDPNHEDAVNRLKIKAIIYFQLNFYDELFVSIAENPKFCEEFEFDDWQEYMKRRIVHPLVREVLEEDLEIFGKKFVAFARFVWQDPKNMKVEPRII